MIKKIIKFIKENPGLLLVGIAFLLPETQEGFEFAPFIIGASGIYNRFKANLMNKIVDMEGDTIHVALMTDSHGFSSGSVIWANVSGAEASGTGYVSKGTALTTKAVTEGATTKWDADDVTWSTATITAHHAVIFDETVADDPLICSFDFGGAKEAVAGNFKIEWHGDGILTLATA